MEITDDIIKKTALLARINLREEEVEPLRKDLADILHYIDTLSEVNTDHIEPTIAFGSKENVLREDTVKHPFEARREDFLALAPKSDHGHFVVPKVL